MDVSTLNLCSILKKLQRKKEMNTISCQSITITQNYIEPPITDIGKKAREIMSTSVWEQSSNVENILVPDRIFREVLEKVGLTNLEEVNDGIPVIIINDRSIDNSEDKAATELFQSITYNIENKIYAKAKQKYGAQILTMLQGKSFSSSESSKKCDYDIYHNIRNKLKTFFEVRGLEFKDKYSSLQGGTSKVWVAIRWSDAKDQKKTSMIDFVFEKN